MEGSTNRGDGVGDGSVERREVAFGNVDVVAGVGSPVLLLNHPAVLRTQLLSVLRPVHHHDNLLKGTALVQQDLASRRGEEEEEGEDGGGCGEGYSDFHPCGCADDRQLCDTG